MAQLVGRSLLTLEVRCSHPVIGICTINCFEKTKIKKKRVGVVELKNIKTCSLCPVLANFASSVTRVGKISPLGKNLKESVNFYIVKCQLDINEFLGTYFNVSLFDKCQH